MAYVIALTTIHTEQGTIMKGDHLDASDPRVRGRDSFFIRADSTSDQRRQAEADLWIDAASATYKHPPGPAPRRMRATRRIVVEIPTSKTIEVTAGQEVMSDDEVFIASAGRGWEPADKPSRRGAKAKA